MPIVKIPDGRLVRFPDEMANEQIKDIIRNKFPEAYASEDKVETPLLQLSDEQKSVIAARNKAYEDKQKNASFDWETFAEGFLEGAPLGAEKVAVIDVPADFKTYDDVPCCGQKYKYRIKL